VKVQRLGDLLVGGCRITGAELGERVLRAATALQVLGVTAGDAVALLMRNDAPFIEVTLAAQHLGAYAVPINWHAKATETAYIVADCHAKVLIAHADLLRNALDGLPAFTATVAVETWGEMVTRSAPIQEPAHTATESLVYTSGTSGKPKGVKRRVATPDQVRMTEEMRRTVYGITGGARTLLTAPLYHTAPNMFGLRGVREGDLLVLRSRFDPEELLQDIERYRITHLYAVATMFTRLLKLPDDMRSRYDLSSLSFVIHAGGPCAPAVKRAMIEWWGPILNEYYGATEMGPITFVTSAEWLERPGTVGRAMRGIDARVLDEAGRSLPAGSIGEIGAYNPGYPDFTYLNQEAARAELQRGAVIATGDLGYFDDAGYLFLCDRKRDMIISGGVNIYPAEVEAALLECAGVADCAVFGMPDDEFGEAVMAVVQPEPARSLDVAQLTEALSQRLSRYKVPRRIEVRTDLPREETGKIRKRLLREEYWRGAGRAI
jgi:long-chain acyl-CoA synthetase